MSHSCGTCYVQVQAEKAAWKLAEELGVDLVTILPSSICGPPIRRAPGYSVDSLKVVYWSHRK